MKLDAKALRLSTGEEIPKKHLKKNPVYIIVDNVLDTYNIGAIFRLADAVAVDKVFLCGETETPPNHRIKKASINTTEWVDWEYSPSAVEAIATIRAFDPEVTVYAIEQNERSVPYDKVDYSFPAALIIGHETTGVSKEALDASDAIVEMPMWGVNISLNVMVSLGIVLYQVMQNYPSAK